MSRRVIVVCAATVLALYLFVALALLQPQRRLSYAPGSDFITFWAASHLVLQGKPASVYDSAALAAQQALVLPYAPARVWYYPPTFLLAIAPLAALPYLVSYICFMLATLLPYLWLLWRSLRSSEGMICVLAFSGLWFNLLHGQNAFLTAALAAAGILMLETRPILAGICIGLLAIKPHLAMLFPLALLAASYWRALFAAAITATIFALAGLLAFGPAVIDGFMGGLNSARLSIETGLLPWQKIPNLFAAARMLGVDVGYAYLLQSLGALTMAWLVWRAWRAGGALLLRGALLMSATFFVSPYCFDYDLAWLAFPIAWLTLDGIRNGWKAYEGVLLALAWLLPTLMLLLAIWWPLPVAPAILAGLAWMAWRRLRTQHDAKSQAIISPAASRSCA